MPSSRTTGFASTAPSKPSERDYRFMYRTHKIALDPTDEQLALLERQADYARAAYNWALRCYSEGRKAGRELTTEALKREWNAVKSWKYPWGKALSQGAAEYAIEALGHGLRAWKNRSQKNTRPRFHSRTRKPAFRIGNPSNPVRCAGSRSQLPLAPIGNIRMRQELRYKDGPIIKVSVKREAGKVVRLRDGEASETTGTPPRQRRRSRRRHPEHGREL